MFVICLKNDKKSFRVPGAFTAEFTLGVPMAKQRCIMPDLLGLASKKCLKMLNSLKKLEKH